MSDTTWLSDLWELAKSAGPFGTGLMLFIWWRADAERRHIAEEKDALIERVLTSMNETRNTLRDLAVVFSSSPQQAPQPVPDKAGP